MLCSAVLHGHKSKYKWKDGMLKVQTIKPLCLDVWGSLLKGAFEMCTEQIAKNNYSFEFIIITELFKQNQLNILNWFEMIWFSLLFLISPCSTIEQSVCKRAAPREKTYRILNPRAKPSQCLGGAHIQGWVQLWGCFSWLVWHGAERV
jgi:hypothetical protein